MDISPLGTSPRTGTTRHRARALILGVVAASVGAAALALPAEAAPAPARTYVVVLDGSPGRAETAALRHGVTPEHTYTAAVNGYAARLTARQAAEIAASPGVARVVPDTPVQAWGDQVDPPSWGLDRIDQRKLPLDKHYRYSTTASNVSAYVVDTGVRASHEDFGGRVRGGVDLVDNDGDPNDGNGHGTFMAGLVGGKLYGVAKGVTIVPVRVLNDSGSGSTATVIAGLDWIAKNARKPAVVNMSLGGPANQALDDAVRKLIASGVTVSVPAGSSGGPASNFSPARVTEAITSASLDSRDCAARNSNTGPAIDLYAPGQLIVGPWITSDSARSTLSGSSLAAAHTTGAAALRLGTDPAHTPAQVQATLVKAASTGVCDLPSTSPNRILHTGPFRG